MRSETAALAIAFTLVIPCTAAGLALMNAGLGRSKNAAHALMGALCVFATASIVYGFCGSLFLKADGVSSPAAWFQMLGAGIAGIIPLGAGAERWRLRPAIASTALFAGIVYPLFAHWARAGWLAQLGTNHHLGGGFADAGGSASIQAAGGLAALSVAWILGPRRGKYSVEGASAAIPGHNSVFVLLGCFLTLTGWFGLNGAGALLFAGADAAHAALAGVNTILAASAAGLAAAAITNARVGKPDVSLTANGWVGGLAASSAGCVFMGPEAAALVGGVAGALVVFSVELLESHAGVDDPAGALSAHGAAGIWGLAAVAIAGRPPGGTGQWIAQLLGVATLLGFVLPGAYLLNWLVDRFSAQRASPDAERRGLDLDELGAGAYPELPAQTDDYLQRWS